MKRLSELNGFWDLMPVTEFSEVYIYYDNYEGFTFRQQLPSHWQQLQGLETYEGKMVYRKRLEIHPDKNKRYLLKVNGIFYKYSIYLNQTKIGVNEGYFIPQIYDITELVRPKNTFIIEVECWNEREDVRKECIMGIFSGGDCVNPSINPGGIWLPIEIYTCDTAYIENSFFYTQEINEDKSALVAFTIAIDSTKNVNADIRISFTPQSFEGTPYYINDKVNLIKGKNITEGKIKLDKCELWWCHDIGTPNLYSVSLELTEGDNLLDADTQDFGIRIVKFEDSILNINNKRIFLRGSNYPPTDARLATITFERCQQDLKLAKQCNINLLRVHSHVGHPHLYKAADREGILIWQDFPLQSQYKISIIAEVKKQLEGMIGLLYNHPSIVLWCMHNEPFPSASREGVSIWSNIKRRWGLLFYTWERNVMDKTLMKMAQDLDKTRYSLRSSGGDILFNKGGDRHFYFGWHKSFGSKRRFERLLQYARYSIRMVSEFGAQSLPNYENAIKMAGEDIKKLDWKLLEKKYCAQPDTFRLWLDIDKQPTIEKLVEITQQYQAEINQYYIDRLRYYKYSPVGVVVSFMFQDSNPAVSCSIVDYWRKPKQSYYKMKISFNPQYVFVLLKKDKYKTNTEVYIPIYIVNDSYRAFNDVKIIAALVDSNERRIRQEEFDADLNPDCKSIKIGEIRQIFANTGDYKLVLKMTYNEETLINTYRIPIVK